MSLNVVVLHPHYKLDYVALIFEHGYEFDKVQSLTKDVKHFSSRLYEFYKESGTCNSDISKWTVSNNEAEVLTQWSVVMGDDNDDNRRLRNLKFKMMQVKKMFWN